MSTLYEKEIVELLVQTKAKALFSLIVEGNKGTSFEIRCTNDSYLRKMPAALIEIASRIEGELAKKDMKEKEGNNG